MVGLIFLCSFVGLVTLGTYKDWKKDQRTNK